MLKLIAITEVNYESIIDYKISFINQLNEVSRVVCMSTILKQVEYFQWLKRNKVENYFFMVDDNNPNYIIGDCMFNLNMNIHVEHSNRGAINYSIRPNERNKHYGTYMLKLLLDKCQELGIKEIAVSCLENNTASKKVIENNGGILDKRYFDIKTCDYALKYCVDLKEKRYVKI